MRQGFCDYCVLRPLDGGKATVKGFTLSYQQPFGDTGFGMYANYTYADGETKSGQDLPYNSKNASTSVRTTRRVRSRRASPTAGAVTISPAVTSRARRPRRSTTTPSSMRRRAWRFSDNFSLNLNAMNLLDETYLQYLGRRT